MWSGGLRCGFRVGFEDGSKRFDGGQLFVTGCCRGLCYSGINGVECVDDFVFWCEGQDREIMWAKFDCITDDGGVRWGGKYSVASVMAECGANVVPVVRAVFP